MPAKNKLSDDSAFKNWINKDVVQKLALQIQLYDKNFPKDSFQKVSSQLAPLELKARVQLICDSLIKSLSSDYLRNLKLIVNVVTQPKDAKKALQGFELWPLLHYIQTQGLDHPKASLLALETLTEYFTAEFAVRPYIIHHSSLAFEILKKWSESSNLHHRRLASEGSRPRLPWGEQIKALIANPHPTLPILYRLRFDDELYVRKSVANHLNDISKDNPSLMLETLRDWQLEAQKLCKEHKISMESLNHFQWILQHSLRGLVKKSNPQALKLVGIDSKARFQLTNLMVRKKKISVGGTLEFSFEIHNPSTTAEALIDFVIHYQKANKKLSPKVFKLTRKKIERGQTLSIQKRHSFKVVTTRKLYAGLHELEIIVNGQASGKISFHLQAQSS